MLCDKTGVMGVLRSWHENNADNGFARVLSVASSIYDTMEKSMLLISLINHLGGQGGEGLTEVWGGPAGVGIVMDSRVSFLSRLSSDSVGAFSLRW